MRRRELMLLLGGAAFLDTPIGRAQEPGRVYRLGIMFGLPREEAGNVALFDELRRAGFIEGENLQVDGRFSMREEEAPEVAAVLVAAGVDAIVTGGYPRARVVQQATRTIPILVVADDLVLSGLVPSLAHPGGNTTGISILATELDGKRLEILIELVPTVRHVGVLADSNVTSPRQLSAQQDAGRARGIQISIHRIMKGDDVVGAIEQVKASGAEALNVLATPLLNSYRQLIIERAAVFRLPAIYQWPETAKEGGLAAYGPNFAQVGRQNAEQLAKVLHGTKPADLPVQQPTKFELVINLKTAKALGLTVPPALLARADEVIE
jgi:putative ABC transport system substrate-binding protein